MASRTIQVAIVVAPGCVGSTVHGLLDAFLCANACAAQRAVGAKPFDVRLVSADGKSVAGYTGHRIEADGDLATAEGCDILLLAPIMPALTAASEISRILERLGPLSAWLRDQARSGACIATACTGSFLLAEAGLLDGRVATTHWRTARTFRSRYPKVILRESELITDDGAYVCSGGAVAYLDLALHLVRRFVSPDLALRCARMLVFDPGRDQQSPYSDFEPQKAHGDRMILRAQEWLESNYARDIEVEPVAASLGMSARNFKRRFRAACGEPMTSYLQRVRLAAACRRLTDSDTPLQQIVFEVGYADASSFSRLFKQATGATMGEYRKRFHVADRPMRPTLSGAPA